ncbi:MAG: ATP-binding cassette domain-containing protein [Comamonadaceae bacterium]|nr:MAG: ATP-binding cassette domain-containing protein [Comamonadaceae bacterium]
MSTPISASTPATLLKVVDLVKQFPVATGTVRAVDGVSFELGRGRILGLVGESGSGKTTVGRSLLRLVEPTSGRAEFEGVDLFSLSSSQMRAYRRRLQMVFQDPYSSLNPRLRVADIIGEAIDTHRLAKGAEKRARIADLLTQVGLSPDHARRYPHEFSGGQRQRIGIARALAVEPECIIADEPVSALDVSVQAQIINQIQDLQQQRGLSVLFISHDLTVVEHLCDDIVVMYLGRVMESGPSEQVYSAPRHPYTRALLSASPVADPYRKTQRIALRGDIPSPLNPPSGCVFRTRCPHAIDDCAAIRPELETVGPTHKAACIRLNELV